MGREIKIYINGKEKIISAETNILELLKELNLQPERVAVEINKNVIPKQEFSNYVLKDGDKIEVVRFVGGG